MYKKVSDPDLMAAIRKVGPDKTARLFGIHRSAVYRRRRVLEERYAEVILPPNAAPSPIPAGRLEIPFTDGYVFVGSDAHYWPGLATTSHRAFVRMAKEYKPKLVIMNGDVIIGATISKHKPIGWENMPTVKEELDAAKIRLGEILKATPSSRFIWPLGNHDARFETRLADVAPEFREVHGVHLKDHFPEWEPAWSAFVGGERGMVVKHRFKGGLHAPLNNTLWAGRTTVTGHLHSQKCIPLTDYNGTRWGVDTGTMAEPTNAQFTGYTEDNPLNWIEGFAIFRFKGGRLLQPQLVRVMEPGLIDFQGDVFHV